MWARSITLHKSICLSEPAERGSISQRGGGRPVPLTEGVARGRGSRTIIPVHKYQVSHTHTHTKRITHLHARARSYSLEVVRAQSRTSPAHITQRRASTLEERGREAFSKRIKEFILQIDFRSTGQLGLRGPLPRQGIGTTLVRF